jgi:CheY-like chemotaxis protein
MRPKKTILCVDDNDQHLSIRKFMLETKGYNVITCTNGKDALEAFNKGGVDLILCDLMMPEMNGAEVVKMIKASSPDTPAIIFSGKIKIYDKDLHADVFLPKGMYAPTELLERIRLLTIRKRGPKKARVPAASLPAATTTAEIEVNPQVVASARASA